MMWCQRCDCEYQHGNCPRCGDWQDDAPHGRYSLNGILAVAVAAILFVLLLASIGQCADIGDSVCKVMNQKIERQPDGSYGYPGGSATLVSVNSKREGLLVSCAHIFENGGKLATVTFPTVEGEWNARVIAVDHKNDISALVIGNPPVVSMPSCIRPAREGDGPFTCIGYPGRSGGKRQYRVGEYIGYEGGRLYTRGTVISGCSGGARLNRFGEYVGPVCGNTSDGDRPMDRTYGPSGTVLSSFLKPYIEVQK